MKRLHIDTAAVIAILIIVLFITGCTSEKTGVPVSETRTATPPIAQVAAHQTKPVEPVPTNAICADPPLNPWTWIPESYKPSVTPALLQKKGALVSKADLFGTPALRWDEYNNSQKIRGLPDSYGTSRMEKTRETSGGLSVIHENLTYVHYIHGEPASLADTTMDDTYYDKYGNMVSMHRRVIKDGKFLENADRPPVNMGRGTPDCPGDIYAPQYICLGKDPVTVSVGSFPDAVKYSVRSTGDSGHSGSKPSYWFAPGVPIPVKWTIEDPEGGSYVVYELTGWG